MTCADTPMPEDEYLRLTGLFEKKFVARTCHRDAAGLRVGDTHVMFRAEAELMQRHARALLRTGAKRLLEVGFGLGLFAQAAQDIGIESHTIIELHPAVASQARDWRQTLRHPEGVAIVEGSWHKAAETLAGPFDAVMYDASPPRDLVDADFHYFVTKCCRNHLAPMGTFSFFHPGKRPKPSRVSALRNVFDEVRWQEYELPEYPDQWSKSDGSFLVPLATKGRSLACFPKP